jgi:hypothetical protein
MTDTHSRASRRNAKFIFEAKGDGTIVSIEFKDIPPGIRPEDNEEGTRETLEKLARYVEQGAV